MTEHHATLLSRNNVFQEATQGAPSELLEILEKARNFLTTTVADSTKEIYARDWKGFVRWCDNLGLPHLPSSPDVVACYFTSLAMKEFRVPTIRRHCAAIAAAHRGAGYPTPTSHPAIKELLHGMTRKIEGMQARFVSEHDVAECLRRLEPVWDELFPLEQSRIVHLLIESVTVNTDGMNIKIRGNGLHSLVSEVRNTENQHERSYAE